MARTIVLRRLESAPRTRGELSALLLKRNVPEDVAERVLDRFTEVGLIDDRAFAEAWVTTRHAGRGLGRRRLGAELRRREIAPDLVREALALVDPEAERARAREFARRRLLRMADLPAAVQERRVVSALLRRGYPAEVAGTAVREALAEGDPASPD